MRRSTWGYVCLATALALLLLAGVLVGAEAKSAWVCSAFTLLELAWVLLVIGMTLSER